MIVRIKEKVCPNLGLMDALIQGTHILTFEFTARGRALFLLFRFYSAIKFDMFSHGSTNKKNLYQLLYLKWKKWQSVCFVILWIKKKSSLVLIVLTFGGLIKDKIQSGVKTDMGREADPDVWPRAHPQKNTIWPFLPDPRHEKSNQMLVTPSLHLPFTPSPRSLLPAEVWLAVTCRGPERPPACPRTWTWDVTQQPGRGDEKEREWDASPLAYTSAWR